MTGQAGRALPWTHHTGDRWSPVIPTGTGSYWSQFQDVTSSKKFQHFSRKVKNGGVKFLDTDVTSPVLELEQGRMELQGSVDLGLGAISELRTSLITSFSE